MISNKTLGKIHKNFLLQYFHIEKILNKYKINLIIKK